MNPQIPSTELALAIDKAYRREWLEEAERDRLVQKVLAERVRPLDRVLAEIGNLLISVGARLQEPGITRNHYQTAER